MTWKEENIEDHSFLKAGFNRIKIFQRVKKIGSSRWIILSLTTKITHQKKQICARGIFRKKLVYSVDRQNFNSDADYEVS